MRARLAIAIGGALALSGPAQGAPAPGGASPYYGRWTLNENAPVLTARGRLYQTIDIAPCGHDFCAVSVGDRGRCGVVLFRLPGKQAGAADVRGRGKWGDTQQEFTLYNASEPDRHPGRQIGLTLGQKPSFSSRSGSMPMFRAVYRPLGGARCMAR